ncbi:GNAT family N-acetyltransferase [Halovulum sp. GXIMD14793]
MVEIIKVTTDNAHLLSNIAEDVFDDPIDQDRLADYLKAPNQVMFVALADNLVVAQARGILTHHPDQAPDLCLENLGTSPAWQRQGIATWLLNAVKDWGANLGYGAFWVATEADNDEGIAFYRALGLNETKVVMFD